MGAIVVTDHMDLQSLGYLAVDHTQEFQEFSVAVARQAAADHDSGEHVQRGEQGGGAVALVLMGIVPARPFFIGSEGWVRSRAWTCDFSSTHNTTDWSGGFRYKPT